MSKKHHYAAGPCLNCSTPLQEGWEYCPNCGQKNQELKLPLGHVLEELAEGIWHFDSKLWATLKAIVTRPGKITVDFLDGRRVRYVPPIRLYVFISFVFFFAASVMQHRLEEAEAEPTFRLKAGKPNTEINVAYSLNGEPDSSELGKKVRRRKALQDSLTKIIENTLDKGVEVSVAQGQRLKGQSTTSVQKELIDSALVLHKSMHAPLDKEDRTHIVEEGVNEADTVLFRRLSNGRCLAIRLRRFDDLVMDSATVDTLVHMHKEAGDKLLDRAGITSFSKRFAARRVARFVELGNGGRDWAEGTDLWHTFFKSASIGMFLFMPLAAFFLWLLFRHQRRFYVEHLIHALHLHAIVFLMMVLLRFLPGILWPHADLDFLKGILLALVIVYPFLSIRRVYRQRLRRTLLKYLIWIILYGILMVLFLVGVFAYGMAVV